ncbi:MAG: helix-turn-helix transcriptional regulator [Actinomycetota bacterium]|nr:helix-turn-helix transcriptional regulator [Actinomycetota bacterium]
MALSARDYRSVLESIDVIYSVPDTGAMFHALCEKLRKFIGIYSAIFVPANLKTGEFLFSGYQIFNNWEGAMLAYLSHYAPQDPFTSCGWFKGHPNEAARNTDLMPELIKTEFATDFLMPMASVFYVIASTLGVQGDIVGMLGIHRQKHEGNFSRRDKEVVNILLPHIARAIHIRELTSSVGLDKEDCGVIMTDESGKPFFMNKEAERALNGSSPDAIPDPGLGCAPVFFKKGRTFRVRTVPIDRKRKGKFTILEPQPAKDKLALKLDGFDLTIREKEVAGLAIQGLSNRQIAERLFITEMTVKDHMKNIFGKLDVKRRSELAAKALVMRPYESKTGSMEKPPASAGT